MTPRHIVILDDPGITDADARAEWWHRLVLDRAAAALSVPKRLIASRTHDRDPPGPRFPSQPVSKGGVNPAQAPSQRPAPPKGSAAGGKR